MSRLDSFIRRMLAQRACLNWAAEAVADIAGPVLELGLGNGRTYDHLRELMPEREIYVFERAIGSFDRAHDMSLPPEKFLILETSNAPWSLQPPGCQQRRLWPTTIWEPATPMPMKCWHHEWVCC